MLKLWEIQDFVSRIEQGCDRLLQYIRAHSTQIKLKNLKIKKLKKKKNFSLRREVNNQSTNKQEIKMPKKYRCHILW
jgi:hypothetical protein